MQISIWDLDWYYCRTAMPNIQCMQLSSYCKQKGYVVNFITKEEHIALNYDKIYIFKDKQETPAPPRKILDKINTMLIGKGFKYFKTKKLPLVVIACRPDYLLYEECGKYSNANFIQFFYDKTLIKNRQDFHNTKLKKKFTIVTDDNFWEQKDEDIIWCLNFLKNERNIMFKHPISLKKIINNSYIKNLFVQLHFTTGTEFKWRNNYSSVDVIPIIDFLKELKTCTKSNLGYIPIKADVEHDIKLDIYRCLKIIYKFKQEKLQCKIISSNTPHHKILEMLVDWTNNNLQLSFVEYILHNQVKTSGVLWYNILNNSIHWRDTKIDMLLWLLTDEEWSDSQYLLFSQWGKDILSNKNVNYKYIKEKINLIYKGENNE